MNTTVKRFIMLGTAFVISALFSQVVWAASLTFDNYTDTSNVSISAGQFESGFLVNGVVIQSPGFGSGSTTVANDGITSFTGTWVDSPAAVAPSSRTIYFVDPANTARVTDILEYTVTVATGEATILGSWTTNVSNDLGAVPPGTLAGDIIVADGTAVGFSHAYLGARALAGLAADIEISSSANSAATITAGSGDSIDYVFTVTNNGPEIATNLVADLSEAATAGGLGTCILDESLGAVASNTWTIGTLTVGNPVTLGVTCAVPASASPGSYSATLDFTSMDQVDPNGTLGSTQSTTINTLADLTIGKSVVGEIVAGVDFTYIIDINNAGPSVAVNTMVIDTLPPGVTYVSDDSACSESAGVVTCDIGSLGVNAPGQINIVVTPAASLPANEAIFNTAAITSPTPGSNPEDRIVRVGEFPVRESDLSITKSDDPDSVVAGEVLTYTLISTNNGPSNADNQMISDSMPADTTFVSAAASDGGVCTMPAVGATGSVDCTWSESGPSQPFSVEIVVLVAASAAPDSPIINVATTKSDSTDPNTDDNSVEESTTVVDVADMSISKLDNIDPAQGGGNSVLIYTVSVYNAGPSDARNVSVFDDLPSVVTFESTDGCSNDPTGVPNCDLGYIASGQGAEYTIVVRPYRSDSLITNTVTVSTSAFDPEDDNNTASQQTQLDAVGIPVNGPLFLALLLLLLSASGWRALRRN